MKSSLTWPSFVPIGMPQQRALVARLAKARSDAARSFDLAGYIAARSHALIMLKSALRGTEHSELFKITETYRAGAEGREKIENLLRTLYALLEDLMFLQSGAPELVRNTDILGELKKMSESADFAWSAIRRGGSRRSRARHAP